MSCITEIHINEDNLVEWDEMQNAADDTYVNNATVSFVLKDEAGTIVAGPVSMPYVVGSNGKYQGVLDQDDAANLVKSQRYWLEITSFTGAGLEGFRRIPVVAVYHGS